MALTISSIKALLASEYQAATDEVRNFVAWVEGKDAEVANAHAQFQQTIAQQQHLSVLLTKAGYSVSAGSINPPA